MNVTETTIITNLVLRQNKIKTHINLFLFLLTKKVDIYLDTKQQIAKKNECD